ncbi:MAG: ABC transporter ATP-binding protein [Endozoicomonas sp. (ex Botrylloides leachii)]|nr:ABC transporter ATP-binding protein [Endozoicomonas sp. (ex Botrylloides leachii)]
MNKPLLSIDNLGVAFQQGHNSIQAINNVSLALASGQTLGLVGESGSGKSITALSILQLLPENASITGQITFDNEDLTSLSSTQIRHIRGNKISMIFQEPMTALNPLHTIEKQITEVLTLHLGLRPNKAKAQALTLLEQVGIEHAQKRLSAYPHELSGGQRQRVMIAMALACKPKLLIADEPTTALDVTVQRQILELLQRLQAQLDMAILFISHDLNLIRHVSDTICVMKDGLIVEHSETERIFNEPSHPYTVSLLAAEPNGTPAPINNQAKSILSCNDLKVWFPIKSGFFKKTVDHFKAVTDLSITVRHSETLGIVGESGSGKTTLGLAILKLIQSKGKIIFKGSHIHAMTQKEFRPLRKQIQIVFQDPYGSLSPRMTVEDIIGEGLDIHTRLNRTVRSESITQALKDVGLSPDCSNRYPHEFSGGQRQRIAIARTIVLKPEIIILDEPTSALDRSVQSQIIQLLRNLQDKYGLSYIFISHDLAVIKAISHRIMVMKAGRLIEEGDTAQIFDTPKSNYTKTLINAAF